MKKFRNNFGKAFAAGTVHDAFNLLTVITLLPLEMASRYLELVSGAIVSGLGNSTNFDSSSLDFMETLKKPIISAIIIIDEDLLQLYADPFYNITGEETFLKQNCSKTYPNKTSYVEPCK
jgi:sodium-dependent phosphate cotransporter